MDNVKKPKKEKKDKKEKKSKKEKTTKRDRSSSPPTSPRSSKQPRSSSPNLSPLPAAYTHDFLPVTIKSTKTSLSSPKLGSIGSIKKSKKEVSKRAERSARFSPASRSLSPPPAPHSPTPASEGFGTNPSLSKPYTRLTSDPNPSNVRPLRVLKAAFKQHKTDYLDAETKYEGFVSELKSIRQDLAVQKLLENTFCVQVYICNVRIALEEGDMDEFNMCQTFLLELLSTRPNYHRHLPVPHLDELLAYNLLYTLLTSPATLSCAVLNTFNTINHKGGDYGSFKLVDTAMSCVKSAINGNWTGALATLEGSVDDDTAMCPYLADKLMDKYRGERYEQLLKSYQKVEIAFVAQCLGMEGGEGRAWIEEEAEGVIRLDMLECRESFARWREK